MNNVRFQHGVSFALRIEVFPVICSLWESERFSSSLKPHMEGNLHSPDKSWLPVIPLQSVPNRSPKLKDSGLLIVAVSESAEKHNPSLCFFFFSNMVPQIHLLLSQFLFLLPWTRFLFISQCSHRQSPHCSPLHKRCWVKTFFLIL